MAKPRPDERALALYAVARVRMFGGVLEHPKRSKLWPVLGLPRPGQRDEFGGWTLLVNQSWWGHRAEKATALYIVGCEPADVPPYQVGVPGVEPCVIGTSGRRVDGSRAASRPEVTKREREGTPPAFARWLVELASRCDRARAA